MAGVRDQRFRLEATFDAPPDFAFRWCTDYSPEDPHIERDDYERRILARGPRRVLYQDLGPQGKGWFLNTQTVTLRPPGAWHAESVGTYRTWSIDYAVRPVADGRSRFTFDGVRRPTPLAGAGPKRSEVEANLRTLWGRFGRALARDYRRSGGRSSLRGRAP